MMSENNEGRGLVIKMIAGRVGPLDPNFEEGAANSARHFARAIQEARVGEDAASIALRALENREPGELYDPFTDAALINALLTETSGPSL